MPFPKTSQKGFTLVELLLVVTLLAIMGTAVLVGINPFTQIFKAYDATKKADLDRLRIAFENYYGDHDCYPTQDILNDCDGRSFIPYMERIPCNPETKKPYTEVADNSYCPTWFKIATNLSNTYDPDIEKVGCKDPICGISSTSQITFNYYVGSQNAPVGPAGNLVNTTTKYYCSGVRNCSVLSPHLECPAGQSFDFCDPNIQCTMGQTLCTPTVKKI